jgi:hypothetical protein
MGVTQFLNEVGQRLRTIDSVKELKRIQLEIASIVPGDPIFPPNDTDTEDAV